MTRREEVLRSFCETAALVGGHLQYREAFDCFCITHEGYFQFSDDILAFVRDAVAEKIERKRIENERKVDECSNCAQPYAPDSLFARYIGREKVRLCGECLFDQETRETEFYLDQEENEP